MYRFLQIVIVLLVCFGLSTVAAKASSITDLMNSQTGERIEALLNNRIAPSAALVGVTRLFSHEQILELYEQRSFQPIWLDGWQLKPEAETLLEYLRGAGAHGLCSSDYLLAQLEGLIRIQSDFARHNLPLAPDNRAVLDLFLSQSFLTFATHMVEGQVDPSLAHVDWRVRRRKADLVKLLEYAIEKGRMSQVLEGFFPPHQAYRQLVDILEKYQRLAANGGWPVVPAGRTLRPGDRDDRVIALKQYLLKTGDMIDVAEMDNAYDEATEEAVRVFQSRHGLVDDGVIGTKTYQVMAISVEERIWQIELNLERWRWMPKSFGNRYISVNVADFSLEVVEDDQIVLRMPVIVGTQYRKTPVFSARMTYLEFAPYWTVPPTILREDKLPKIKHNSDYLQTHHFRIISGGEDGVEISPAGIDWATVDAETFPGMLRMEPGPWNPLGRVKFMFPNRFNVYLHDTNERWLFDKNIRSFSSGCIRVKEPEKLARYLLGEKFDAVALQKLLNAQNPEQIGIEPIPVHVQYWTAWVDEEGRVQFRPDVYFRDLDLEIALTEPAYRVMDQLKVSAGTHLANLHQ